MSTIKIIVKGMTCKHCIMRVEKSLMDVDSVDKVNTNLNSGEVTIEHSSNENSSRNEILPKLVAAVENAGYSVVE